MKGSEGRLRAGHKGHLAPLCEHTRTRIASRSGDSNGARCLRGSELHIPSVCSKTVHSIRPRRTPARALRTMQVRFLGLRALSLSLYRAFTARIGAYAATWPPPRAIHQE
jgi:hypothetical protein